MSKVDEVRVFALQSGGVLVGRPERVKEGWVRLHKPMRCVETTTMDGQTLITFDRYLPFRAHDWIDLPEGRLANPDGEAITYQAAAYWGIAVQYAEEVYQKGIDRQFQTMTRITAEAINDFRDPDRKKPDQSTGSGESDPGSADQSSGRKKRVKRPRILTFGDLTAGPDTKQ